MKRLARWALGPYWFSVLRHYVAQRRAYRHLGFTRRQDLAHARMLTENPQ